MYDDAFPEQTSAALRVDPPAQPVFRSMWSGTGAALKGFLPVAGAEVAATLAPIIEDFGRVRAWELDPTRPKTPGKLLTDYDTLPPLRKFQKRMAPAPETTGAAANVVFGAGKLLGQAGGFALLGGLPAAAIGTGAVAGTTEAQRLTLDEGVDKSTAAAVGAVRGLATGVTIALPAAAATKLGTAGLAAVGGPGSFMAEQAAGRAILEAADYNRVARQYDPFDPMGLAISTILAGAAGTVAHAVRSARTRSAITPEMEAAARTLVEAEHVAYTGLHRPGDIAAATKHADALELVRSQIDEGRPVDVRNMTLDEANIAANDAARVMREAVEAPSARADSPGLTDPDYQQALYRMGLETGYAETGGKLIREVVDGDLDYGLGLGTGKVLGRTPWVPNAEWWPGRPKGLTEAEAQTAIAKALAGEKLRAPEQKLIDYMLDYARERIVEPLRRLQQADEAERAAMANALAARALDETPSNLLDLDLTARAAQIDEAAVEAAAVRFADDDAGFMAEMRRIARGDKDTATTGSGETAESIPAGPGRDIAEAVATARAIWDRASAEGGNLARFLTEQPQSAEVRNLLVAMQERAGQIDDVLADFDKRVTEGRTGRTDADTIADAVEGTRQAKGAAPDMDTAAAQSVAQTRPDLLVPDETTGQLRPAAEMLADAERKFQADTADAAAYRAAVTCFLAH